MKSESVEGGQFGPTPSSPAGHRPGVPDAAKGCRSSGSAVVPSGHAMSAVRLAAASAAALGVWLWWRWRRRQEGPWLLRRVTVLDEVESGYRELDVLLGASGQARMERRARCGWPD